MKLTHFIPFSKNLDDILLSFKSDTSYRVEIKSYLKKHRLTYYSWKIIQLLFVIALLADFIANEKPIAAKYEGKVYFPILKGYLVDAGIGKWQKELHHADWKSMEYNWVVRTPIPYSPHNIDKMNDRYASPFAKQQIDSIYWRHWLGTDQIGRDVMAGMIHGTRIAVLVGIVSMLIAMSLGLFFGISAGYFGDSSLSMSYAQLSSGAIFGLYGLFLAFGTRGFILSESLGVSTGAFIISLFISLGIFLLSLLIGNGVAIPLSKVPFLSKRVFVPVDMIITRTIDVLLSIPTLFLIISIIALVKKPNLFIIMAIIGLTAWTGIARLIRVEFLKIKSMEYVEAAKALGFSQVRTVIQHILPNAISPVLVALAFGIAGAILTESFLSFLGLLPGDVVTWGSMLSEARSNASAWWLAVFPGLAIFITVTIYNLVGEGITDALDPKKRDHLR
jgi:peptide/nickel transport system permease protein